MAACVRAGADYSSHYYRLPNGKIHGYYISYYWGTNIKSWEVLNVDGEQHGTYISYYKSGRVNTVKKYFYGELHGKLVRYRENGTKDFVQVYVNNVMNGRCIEYDSDGKVCLIEEYVDGMKSKIIYCALTMCQ
jgi:antitoxin component YwqK of YwqJK toxin-antitoxin module